MNFVFNLWEKGNHEGAKASDVGLQGCSMFPGTWGAQCASTPAGDAVFVLSLHHGICPQMLVSRRHSWFIPICLSKNCIWGKLKFTKCPAGSDAHDCGFYRHLAVVYLALWGEKRKEKWILWLTGLQTRAWQGASVKSRKWMKVFLLQCIFAVIASWLFLVLLLTEAIFSWHFSIIAHSIKMCKIFLK